MKVNERESNWEKIIKDWQVSGKTAFHYCKKHKLSTSSFYKWRKRFLPEYRDLHHVKQEAQDKPSAFLPVALKENLPTHTPEASPICELHFSNGCMLRLYEGYGVEQLAQLASIMGLSSC